MVIYFYSHWFWKRSCSPRYSICSQALKNILIKISFQIIIFDILRYFICYLILISCFLLLFEYLMFFLPLLKYWMWVFLLYMIVRWLALFMYFLLTDQFYFVHIKNLNFYRKFVLPLNFKFQLITTSIAIW